jgi:hypothetical protein
LPITGQPGASHLAPGCICFCSVDGSIDRSLFLLIVTDALVDSLSMAAFGDRFPPNVPAPVVEHHASLYDERGCHFFAADRSF